MDKLSLSFNSKKCLSVHLGDEAGEEIAALLRGLAEEIEDLRRSKVDVTQVAPSTNTEGKGFNDAASGKRFLGPA
ncbi:hypothetical protein [Crateriforma conspicua]|uniref:Uncharacterized protein n=1 Tax=Crateriforma conspicua TaxID=2527996 RepID=A0A5C5Y609_9PLAN|nr:hypothetical protein [Crateriforma conspicua]QDV65159.1 hypothetical protein Mal65_43290 [Crateriforma conspicua]TWT70554.1 hypothetical protein Pan14r_28610 [Crateriforma conspicua]